MPTLKRWNETTQLWEPLQLIGAELGAPNGVATLDNAAKVPLAQLPELSSVVNYEITLLAANWTGVDAPYTQTVATVGMLSTDKPIVDIKFGSGLTYEQEQAKEDEWLSIQKVVAGVDEVTFYSKIDNVEDIEVSVKVVR